MRIVGGEFKGRIFTPGKSFKARPTTDFAKENLFNILENHIDWETTDALDLFSGTGSISYELISRGCRWVTAVEQNFRHYRYISSNKELLQLQNFSVLREDAFRFMEKSNQQFSLIFADPPFDMKRFDEVAEKVLTSSILSPGGVFILEHGKHQSFAKHPRLTEIRSYGSVNFSFFK